MAVAAKVKQFLDGNHVPYRILRHSRKTSLTSAAEQLTLPCSQLLKTDILVDNHGYIMVVYPYDRRVDFNQLKKTLNRHLTIMPWYQINRIFSDCEPGAYPPFGAPYGLNVLLDSQIEQMDNVYFEPGSHTCILSLGIDDFLYLMNDAIVLPFTGEKYASSSKELVQTEIYNIDDERVKRTCRLPCFPLFGELLLNQACDETQDIQPLVSLLSTKPELVDWLLDFSALFAHFIEVREKPETLYEVIEHLMTAEMLKYLALFAITMDVFNFPLTQEKPIRDLMTHTLMTTLVSYKMAEKLKKTQPEKLFNDALFHNVGLMLFAYLFPPEYDLLNQWIKSYPQAPIEQLEKRLIGLGKAQQMVNIGHAKLGAWLLEYWQFPTHHIDVSKAHHVQNIPTSVADEVIMIQAANTLLRERGFGDGGHVIGKERFESEFRIVISEFNDTLDKVMSYHEMFSSLADKLCLANA